MGTCENLEELLSGYIDGELNDSDRQRVKQHLAECHQCAMKVIEMNELRHQIGHIQFQDPPPELWDEHAKGLFETSTRGLGWLLYVVGGILYVLAVVSFLWKALTTGKCDWRFVVGLFALLGGTVFLLVAVLQQRIRALKTDRYRDIIR